MSLRINDTIPNLTVETDQGCFALHDWIGDSWPFYFRTRKISPRFAQPSSAQWRNWPMNGPNAHEGDWGIRGRC